MMGMEIESAVKNLEQKYQSINQFTKTDWDFFLHIANYVKFIKEEPAFQAVISKIKEIKLDQSDLENYKNQAIQELQKKRDNLIAKIKEEKVSFKGSQVLLTKLQKCKSTDPDALFLAFSAFTHELEMGDYYKLAEIFRDVEIETREARFYTPSKAYALYRSEKERLDSIKKTELELGFNNAWENLELIYFLIFEKDNYFKKIILKPNLNANVREFSVFTDEIERIKNGSPSYHFQREKFRQYLLKVHSSLTEQFELKGVSIRAAKKTQTDFLSVDLEKQKLEVNTNTGVVKLNKLESKLNPESQEFKILVKLMSSKNHKITYNELLGDNAPKSRRRCLTFIVRNLKKSLGILPKEKARNKDIIKNIKNHGYMLAS